MAIKAPKGTKDMLPQDSYRWQYIENEWAKICSEYGFRELRTPMFESTDLFNRGVGDTTDIVQKEMYTFEDMGGRSITLKPEGTSPAVRAFIESNIYADTQPTKVYYDTPCFRYEKPQAGRLREFHQFGVECMGAAEPSADAEVIALGRQVLSSVGIEKISLEINSIGCPECRKEYHKALKEYFSANIDELCGTCKERLDRNPMRILDCKSPVCSGIAEKAPVVLDYLCDDCKEHFEQVKAHLTAQGIEYTVNPHIVRGLDYYTRTVFEFVSGDIGAQATVCGGGRYDGLISQMGGPSVPSLGFGMGIERLMLVLKNQGAELPDAPTTDIYIATMGEKAKLKATALCAELRAEGYKAQTDICARGLKAQMKYADKIGAKFTVVLGDDEIENGKAGLKDMKEGTVTEIKLDELVLELGEAIREQIFKNIAEII